MKTLWALTSILILKTSLSIEAHGIEDSHNFLTPPIVNAILGPVGNEMQSRYPELKRVKQITPGEIDLSLNQAFAEETVMGASYETYAYIAERAKLVALNRLQSFHQTYGHYPYAIYCDEIRVDYAMNPLTLFWWYERGSQFRPSRLSKSEALLRADKLLLMMQVIQAGFNQAIALEKAPTIAMQGMGRGVHRRDEDALYSFYLAAEDFHRRYGSGQESIIPSVVIWDYWGLSADSDLTRTINRSLWSWVANKKAFGGEVARFFRSLQLNPAGGIHDEPEFTPEQVEAWYSATPYGAKGVWEIGYGATEEQVRDTAPEVLETLLNLSHSSSGI